MPAPPFLDSSPLLKRPTQPPRLVIETIKTVYDPEIPVDIYELGLIYDIVITAEGKVDIKMTLTSPGCPVAAFLPRQVELKIRTIDSDRYVWPHVLEEVTRSLPDYTWLVGLNVVQAAPMVTTEGAPVGPVPVRFMIDGRTSDIGAYTRFLRNLANSPWMSNVVPGATRTVVEDEKALTAFSITATFRQADSSFIRTVPVSASVR